MVHPNPGPARLIGGGVKSPPPVRDGKPVPQSVQQLLEMEWGVKTRVVDSRDATDADITDKIIARNDPGRLGLIIVNLSGNNLFIRPLLPATTTAGIRINATGGQISMNWREDLLLQTLEWHGIANVDDSAIFVLEVLMLGTVD